MYVVFSIVISNNTTHLILISTYFKITTTGTYMGSFKSASAGVTSWSKTGQFQNGTT